MIIVIAEPKARITPKAPSEMCKRCFLYLMSKLCTKNSNTQPKANAPWKYIENGALKVPEVTGSRNGFANPIKTAKRAIIPMTTKNKGFRFFAALFPVNKEALNLFGIDERFSSIFQVRKMVRHKIAI
ncbi:hypothetical protein LZ575_06085 [Antarcticibacterium sp. 1MA-6-2]|uniref:hypothetical protein n=1 Tax=Antarcticibacterium sp. 1MA-6-2 TaxID=2908210 RepID=UPI001F2AADF4|nr:hypothetical protein [Antarcticibacterium sp. 1MA-6-2]UJH92147.1 hypothetical protein LZ575_06085 [Antarcticibacterium sp. 1MA-6-2]